jgi:phosphoribosylaminoimidazolecarboxamide formyltransferase/IMP cyclohydrolase
LASKPARLVVLVSGSGTNLQALLDAAAEPAFGAEIVAVGADRKEIEGLARAERAGVPTFVMRVEDFADRAAWDVALADAVASYDPDLVVSAGFMKLFGAAFLGRFAERCVNTHPALLPSFPGTRGVRDALSYGVKLTGCTVHLVDSGVDSGPIIAQAAVPVLEGDDEGTLHERIKTVERDLLVHIVGRMAREGYHVEGRRVLIPWATHASGRRSERKVAEPVSSAADKRPIRRALVSVYDKTGLEDLARGLHDAGVAIVSTGSTAAQIGAAGVPVTPVEELTGFPECLDGRVKTLHPKVHAGILADLRRDEHAAQLRELGVEPFDLVVVNLYPFVRTVASGASPDECVEQIDIGGPSLVRAAAKNHPSVAVVVQPERYDDVLRAVREGGFTLDERKRLAGAAFAHTAEYDVAVASYFMSSYAPADDQRFPAFLAATWNRKAVLRYGENPHQEAALYTSVHGGGLAGAEQLHGKEMSYNNYVDTDAARRAAYDFTEPCVAIIKHANPCGIAIGTDVADAHRRAHACDPVSAFGGVIAANRPVTAEMARQVADVFTEVVCAPDFEPEALEILRQKKNVRLLCAADPPRIAAEFRPVSGGVLLQTLDRIDAPGDDAASWRLVSGEPADGDVLRDLVFAWRAVRAVKSNAILLAAGGATVGVGMGQVNRVDSARLAASRAGDRAKDAVAASDAFFPFPDGLQVLLDAGVRAVVQPGGSVRDEEVVAAAAAAGVTMYLTGTRHFAH